MRACNGSGESHRSAKATRDLKPLKPWRSRPLVEQVLFRGLTSSLKEVIPALFYSALKILLNLERRRKQQQFLVEGFFFDDI